MRRLLILGYVVLSSIFASESLSVPPIIRGGKLPSPSSQPPPPTRIQRLLDTTFNIAFSALYAFDTTGTKDSYKNLRVLWTRALLNKQGRLIDSVAYEVRISFGHLIHPSPLTPQPSPHTASSKRYSQDNRSTVYTRLEVDSEVWLDSRQNQFYRRGGWEVPRWA